MLTINSAGTTREPGVQPIQVSRPIEGSDTRQPLGHPIPGPTVHVGLEVHETPDSFEERQVEIYLKCPARYRYEVVEGLTGRATKSPFLRFHGTVRQAIGWICERLGEGAVVTPDEAVAQLRGIWSERGPVGEPFEDIYWRQAERMVRTTATNVVEGGPPGERVWTADVSGKFVTLRPDRVFEAGGAIVAQRIKTGRKSKSEKDNAVWALLRHAGASLFPGREIRLEAFYPALGVVDPIDPNLAKLAAYSDALARIAQGDFRPSPSDSRDCPSCPFYFVCTRDAG